MTHLKVNQGNLDWLYTEDEVISAREREQNATTPQSTYIRQQPIHCPFHLPCPRYITTVFNMRGKSKTDLESIKENERGKEKKRKVTSSPSEMRYIFINHLLLPFYLIIHVNVNKKCLFDVCLFVCLFPRSSFKIPRTRPQHPLHHKSTRLSHPQVVNSVCSADLAGPDIVIHLCLAQWYVVTYPALFVGLTVQNGHKQRCLVHEIVLCSRNACELIEIIFYCSESLGK